MSLTLYFHPLSSYCQKVLIALYEAGTPFETVVVNFADPPSAAAFRTLWPVGKMPVLRDAAHDRTVPESSIIIEYLGQHYPRGTALIPADPDLALRTRLADRFYDLYVHDPMQRIVGDRLRPADNKDPYGVERAEATLRSSYDLIDAEMASRPWAAGDAFSLADCAAAPPLFFASKLVPFGERHNLSAYFRRLGRRPSVARAFNEAEPYLKFFPG
ncbi:MAG: glutathione S-transferase family protein [Alphaproteobacteria bacterium]|nr:MAG: glutathione S-transferase family protein [Alphaproteobacteria bacterium]